MKLQSQETKKFDPRELRRLAESTRPERVLGWKAWATAGALTGMALVALLHVLH